MTYKLNDIIEFIEAYPEGLYEFVKENNYTLTELEPVTSTITETIIDENGQEQEQEIEIIIRRVQIIEIPQPTAEDRQAKFLKKFFNTSLGYIRRSVQMADGTYKDFLSDLLPVISMGVQSGQPVNIITYTMPDFTEPITDWEQYQEVKAVTPQFIQECFIQLSNDFGVVAE